MYKNVIKILLQQKVPFSNLFQKLRLAIHEGEVTSLEKTIHGSETSRGTQYSRLFRMFMESFFAKILAKMLVYRRKKGGLPNLLW